MDMTKQQRNFFLACGALVAGWWTIASIHDAYMREKYFRMQQARAAQQRARAKAKAAAPGTQGTAPAIHPPAPGLTNITNLSGTWRGQGAIRNRALCTLKLELRDSQGSPGNYAGYSTLSCLNAGQLSALKGHGLLRMRGPFTPAAVILNGTPENGSIRFRVDKTVSADADGCELSGFTATPFGTNKIAVQWQEGSCAGGEILLDRSGR